MAPFGIPPLISIALISLGVVLASQFAHMKLTNREMMTEMKNEIKKLRKKLKELSPKDKEFIEIQNKMINLNMKMMKESLKPTMVTFLPFLLIFWLLSSIYSGTGPIFVLPFSLPIIGNDLGWLAMYAIFTLTFSFAIRTIVERYYYGKGNKK